MNMVEKLAIAPVPKLASPCELGPTMRMPALCRGLDHAALLGFARDSVDLAEAGRHHHRDLDAVGRAILHRADGVVAGDRDDHHLRRFRQIGETLVAFVALHLLARRIDRIDFALEAELVEVVHRTAADLVGISDAPMMATDFGSRAALRRVMMLSW